MDGTRFSMKSNLPQPEPEPINPQIAAVLKQDGVHFITALNTPAIDLFRQLTGEEPVSLVFVKKGRMYPIKIEGAIDPATIPAGIKFSGPYNPP